MKDVLEYTDYHRYIADYFAEKKAKSAFTWQAFMQAAGFSSPVFLKYVSEGRYNLSEDTSYQVASAMGLVGYEQDYFAEMVRLDQAKTDDEKKAIFNRMLALAEVHKVRIIEGDSFRYFESWKNPVLRELAPAMPGAKPLAIARACRQKISAAEVSDALNFLLKAGILQKNKDGNYVQTETGVSTGPMEVTPVAVRGMHRQMGEFALEAIEGVPQNERHFSGLTLGITQDVYDEIVQEIAAFRKRIISIATRSEAVDEVYRLNVQFFPMTKKSVKKD